jgi:hypothetical protein
LHCAGPVDRWGDRSDDPHHEDPDPDDPHHEDPDPDDPSRNHLRLHGAGPIDVNAARRQQRRPHRRAVGSEPYRHAHEIRPPVPGDCRHQDDRCAGHPKRGDEAHPTRWVEASGTLDGDLRTVT